MQPNYHKNMKYTDKTFLLHTFYHYPIYLILP